MKKKSLVIFLFTLIFAIGMIPMNVFAAERDVVAGSTASITVNNAVENDKLAAYKVIDITYDASSNNLTYAWNSAFADYFAGTTSYNNTAYTVEAFAALKSDSDDLKTLLAGLPNYIAANTSISPVDIQTVAANGTATFAGLAMGEYFIRPTSTTSVYQLMLQKVEPTAKNGVYVIDDVTFTAKKEEVTITKTADKTSVTKNEKVAYKVIVDIPTYSSEATDKTFYVADLLPDGLTLDTDSIKVQIEGTDVAADAYTLDTTATSKYTFKVSVSTEQYAASWSANGGKQLVITYTATLNDNSTTEVNVKEINTATFDYSNYPYVENSHEQKTDTAEVTTFAIKIDKFKDGSETTKLAGAKFDLYRTAAAGESGAVTIPHTSVQGIKLEGDLVTDDNGAATFSKYEANGNKYDYYLV
ncbi:MAG: isopeptide-forming domain-containing fimbrial protein, partial [Oscillospiraceae bacterium]|nr:isopeptide-forming domain-containing fimbrial protein [Oscillospiraceae bacterium]